MFCTVIIFGKYFSTKEKNNFADNVTHEVLSQIVFRKYFFHALNITEFQWMDSFILKGIFLIKYLRHT